MGEKNKTLRLFGYSAASWLVTGIGLWGSASSADAAADDWRLRVSSKLLAVYDSPSAARSSTATSQGSPDAAVTALRPHIDADGRVQVDVHYDCSRQAPTKALLSAGLSVSASVRLTPLCVVEGWVLSESLAGIASISGVTSVKVPSYAIHPRLTVPETVPNGRVTSPSQRSGPLSQAGAGSITAIDHNGVTIMRADQFVAQTHTSGEGVTVGVQSTGTSSLQLIKSRGELPAVQVLGLSDGASSPAGDEGTVLLEEVHAVAPGAALAYCGPATFIEYTSCLGQLITGGATVLVDDLIFPQQDLLSADSPAVQGIEQLLAQNPTVTLFTAGGNYNGSYWEGAYTPVSLASLGQSALTCSSGATPQTDRYVAQFDGDPSELLTVLQSAQIPVTFAWADPPGHNASHFDVYWFNSTNHVQVGCLQTATATDSQIATTLPLRGASYTVYIATPDLSDSGKFLKLWVGGDGLTTLSKSSAGAIVTPQSFVAGAVNIGAVNGSDARGNTIEPFSSLGPITLVFPDVRHIPSPVLVAPDGIYVDAAGTYFEGNLFPDGNFYGTSAAAPNAAAVAALIRGAFPFLTPSQLISALESGAAQLGSTVPDTTFGYGRIDAMGALATFPTPTITSLPDTALMANSSSSPYSFAVSGAGPVHFTVSSSNTTLIPSAVVPAGSPGVTIVPADCGTGTLTCTLTVMTADGVSDTVTVTVAALDGANRSATASMKIQVTGTQAPPPPTNSTPPPAQGSGGGGGGGAFDWWTVAGLLILGVRPRRLRVPQW